MIIRAFVILWTICFISPQSVIATGKTTLVIGYVELEKDPRYREERLYAGIEFKPRGRPWAGAEVALRESRILSRALGVKFRFEKVSGKNNEELIAAINRMHKTQNIAFFIMDTPVETLIAVTEATRNKQLLLFNVSESADKLRGIQCKSHLMHTIPSYAMLADGLAQYLVTKRWKNILLLRGCFPATMPCLKRFVDRPKSLV